MGKLFKKCRLFADFPALQVVLSIPCSASKAVVSVKLEL